MNLGDMMKKQFRQFSISLDELTLERIDTFADEKGLGRNSAIRFIVNDYLYDKYPEVR